MRRESEAHSHHYHNLEWVGSRLFMQQLNEAREQSRRLEAQLHQAEQASREDRAQLEECQQNEIAMSKRQQETEREFVALEAKARDAAQQRDMLIKQEAELQESLNDTEAHLDNALKEKAELQEKLKAMAKELENALRDNVETVSDCAEAFKGLERLLRGSEAREAGLSAKLDLEKAKREELQAEQSSLKVADALQRSQVKSKDLKIKVRGRVPQRRFWLLSVCLWNKRPPIVFPALTPPPRLHPSWALQRLERQVAALEATKEAQSERLREQHEVLSRSQSEYAAIIDDAEAFLDEYEALEAAERDRDKARAPVAPVEAKEAPRDSAREAALVAELEHLQAQLKQQQAALFAAEQQQQQQQQQGLEAEWPKQPAEECSKARQQVLKLREEVRRHSAEVTFLKEEIWALEDAPTSSAGALGRLQAAQDFAAEGARARQLEGLLAAAEAPEAPLKEELRKAAEGAAAAAGAAGAAAEREGVTGAQAPMSGRAESRLDTASKTAQVRRVGSPVEGLCRRAA